VRLRIDLHVKLVRVDLPLVASRVVLSELEALLFFDTQDP